MRLPKLWQIADAIDLYSDVLSGGKHRRSTSVPNFPLLLAVPDALKLKPGLVRRLAKLVSAVYSSACAGSKVSDTPECCDRLKCYDRILNERELVPSCIDALRALDSVRLAMPEKTARKKAVVEFNELLLKETGEIFRTELFFCAEQLRILKYGSREGDGQPDYVAVRLETYPRLWLLSTCPPDVLPTGLISECISVFRQGLDLESQWLDSFYPVMSLDSTLWAYYSAADLREFVEVARSLPVRSVLDALIKMQSDDAQHLSFFMTAYRPYVDTLVNVLKSSTDIRNPLLAKTAIDFMVPFLRVADKSENSLLVRYQEGVNQLSRIIASAYSNFGIEDIKKLQHAIRSAYDERCTVRFSNVYAFLDAVEAGRINKGFNDFARVFGSDANAISVPVTSIHQLFRDAQLALWEAFGPVADDIWEQRDYVQEATGEILVRFRGGPATSVLVPRQPEWQEHRQVVLEIAASDDWEDWDKHVTALSRSLFESYVIDGKPPSSASLRDYIHDWIKSSLERTAVARRVIVGSFLYLKYRTKVNGDVHEELKARLLYHTDNDDPDRSDSNYRNHLSQLGTNKTDLNNLVPEIQELWPGEHRWTRIIMGEYK